MARAIHEPSSQTSPRKPAPGILLLLLVGMANAGGGAGGGIGDLFRMIIRWSIIGGGLIGTAALAITAVMNNFTLIDTGNTTLNLMISGGLTLLLGFFMIKGLLQTISPEAGKFLKL